MGFERGGMCLLLLAMGLAVSKARAAGSSAACPATCAAPAAAEWCDRQFGGTGNLTAPHCNASAVVCVCNGAANVTAAAAAEGGACAWPAAFQASPLGARCMAGTGRCPTQAMCSGHAALLLDLFGEECTVPPRCEALAGGRLRVSCDTCGGSVSAVEGDADGAACARSFTPPAQWCDSQLHCGGHGCCSVAGGAPRCTCFESQLRGYWAGERCGACADAYAPRDADPTCRTEKSVLNIIALQSRPSTMTVPMLFVVLLTVLLLMIRRRWVSDEEIYTLPNKVPAVNGRRLLATRPIPARPAGSRGMMNQSDLAWKAAVRKGRL
jgi:hypothetical protein